MRPREAAVLAAVCALAAAVPAARASHPPRTLVPPGGGDVTLGLLLPLRNTWSPPRHAATNQWLAAARLAADDVNADPAVLPGRRLELLAADTGAEGDVDNGPRVSVAAARLAADGAAAVCGPVDPTLSHAAGFALSAGRVNLLDPRGSLSALADQTEHGFQHRLTPGAGDSAAALVRLAVRLGWRRVGLLVDALSETMRDFAGQVTAACEAAGLEAPLEMRVVADTDGLDAAAREQLRAARDSLEVRVWVMLVDAQRSEAVLRGSDEAGLRSEHHTWVYPAAAMWNLLRVPVLSVLRPGDLLVAPNVFAGEAAGMEAWTRRLAARAAADASLDSADEAALEVDGMFTQLVYGAVYTAARGLDRLERLHAYCAAAADPAAHENCTAMAGDFGDDDLTLRRLVRDSAVAVPDLGVGVVFDRRSGGRVADTTVLQLSPEGEVRLRALVPASPFAPVVTVSEFEWVGGAAAGGATAPRVTVEQRQVAPRGLYGALTAAGSAAVLACAACAAVEARAWQHPVVRDFGHRTATVSLAGCVLTLLSGIVFEYVTKSRAVCGAQTWIFMVGLTMVFGPALARVLRVYTAHAALGAVVPAPAATPDASSPRSRQESRTSAASPAASRPGSVVCESKAALRSAQAVAAEAANLHKTLSDKQLAPVVAALLAVDAVQMAVAELLGGQGMETFREAPVRGDEPGSWVVVEYTVCRPHGTRAVMVSVFLWKLLLVAAGSAIALRAGAGGVDPRSLLRVTERGAYDRARLRHPTGVRASSSLLLLGLFAVAMLLAVASTRGDGVLKGHEAAFYAQRMLASLAWTATVLWTAHVPRVAAIRRVGAANVRTSAGGQRGAADSPRGHHARRPSGGGEGHAGKRHARTASSGSTTVSWTPGPRLHSVAARDAAGAPVLHPRPPAGPPSAPGTPLRHAARSPRSGALRPVVPPGGAAALPPLELAARATAS